MGRFLLYHWQQWSGVVMPTFWDFGMKEHCWNLLWSKGPKHQGWEAFNAVADWVMDIVSFSTYPGQDDS